MTRRRRWGFPSLMATGLAAQSSSEPQAVRPTAPPASPVPGPGAPNAVRAGDRRPLSWDREDAALAAAECPWHPGMDFPDGAALLRHVVMHARTWEAEALQAERLRRAMVGRVAGFARDVVERANELGGGS